MYLALKNGLIFNSFDWEDMDYYDECDYPYLSDIYESTNTYKTVKRLWFTDIYILYNLPTTIIDKIFELYEKEFDIHLDTPETEESLFCNHWSIFGFNQRNSLLELCLYVADKDGKESYLIIEIENDNIIGWNFLTDIWDTKYECLERPKSTMIDYFHLTGGLSPREELEEKLFDLENELKKSKNKVEEQESNLNKKILELQADLETANSHKERLESFVEQHQYENEEYEYQQEEYEKTIRELKNSLYELDSEYNENIEINNKLKETIEKMKKDNDSLALTLEQKEKDLADGLQQSDLTKNLIHLSIGLLGGMILGD